MRQDEGASRIQGPLSKQDRGIFLNLQQVHPIGRSRLALWKWLVAPSPGIVISSVQGAAKPIRDQEKLGTNGKRFELHFRIAAFACVCERDGQVN